MVTGSVAANYYAVPRMTRDIDLVVELAAEDAERLCALFEGDFYVDREAVRSAIARRTAFNLIHTGWVLKVDFVVRKDSAYRREEFRLLQRSGAERLKMGCSMLATARALVVASVLEKEPSAPPAALRRALFLRFYGAEFGAEERARIAAWVAREEAGGPTAMTARKVAVNWDDLEMALTTNAAEWTCYLDVRTGEVQMVPSDRLGDDDDGPSEAEIDDGLAAGHLIHVEPLGSSVEYGWMAEFAASVSDDRLLDRLEVALDGRGAFRRFKNVLLDHPAERERWFAHRDERLRAVAREWLAEHGVEPTVPPPEPREGGHAAGD